jgi:hypothetical protein
MQSNIPVKVIEVHAIIFCKDQNKPSQIRPAREYKELTLNRYLKEVEPGNPFTGFIKKCFLLCHKKNDKRTI